MSQAQGTIRKFDLARWVIYLLVALAVVLPYVIPSPRMKFKASNWVKKIYDRIEGLKPGSHVLLAFDFDPASQAELEPMARAVMKHCFRKGLIPIVMTHWSNGIDIDKEICESVAADSQEALMRPLLSGKDWVFLGFRPGQSQLVVNMGENLKGAFEKDYYGQPTADMPALEGVNSLRNIKFAVDFAAGDPGVGMWIVYGADKYGFPLAAGTTAVGAPEQAPFLQSKQLVGLLGGLRGAADYESLVEIPGTATRGMVAQSAAHVLVIGLIIVANVRFLLQRRAGRGKG